MSEDSDQRRTALVKLRDERIAAAYFRPTVGGFVYRAPNPWIIGRPHHYIVTAAQRDAIAGILAPRPRAWAKLALGVILAVALIAVMAAYFAPRYPATTSIVILAGILLLAVFTAHRWAMRRLHRLLPILAGAPRTDEHITTADMMSALRTADANQKVSPRQWVITGFSLAVASLAMIALAIIRWEDGKLFSDPLSLLFAWYAVFLVMAATDLYRSQQNPATAVPAPFVRKLILVAAGLSVISVVGFNLAGGVKRELSGQSSPAAPDWAVARLRYEKAAAAGDGKAMSNLGSLYQLGLGVPQDYAKAKEWFEKAAAAGDGAGMSNLGSIYQFGRGVPRDYAKAKGWFEKAAAAGNGTGMSNLGWLYQNGLGVTQDYAKAKEWFEKAVAAGNNAATSNLGWLYQNGWGVPQDYAKAREWHEKAAAAGSAFSMNELGVLYVNGFGVAPDDAKAREWFEKAAAAGNTDGMQHVASLLDAAKGGPADYPRAARLVLQSAKLGHAWSRTVLGGPLTFLTPSTRTELKRELARLGQYNGPIDDVWDDTAHAAVAAYLEAPR
jgi:TPR repeat protein